MKFSYLIKGLPGHPLHPPLTDATIGTYTVATVLALADVVGLSEHAAAGGGGSVDAIEQSWRSRRSDGCLA